MFSLDNFKSIFNIIKGIEGGCRVIYIDHSLIMPHFPNNLVYDCIVVIQTVSHSCIARSVRVLNFS